MDPLAFLLELTSRAGVPGLLSYLIINRIGHRLDTLTDSVLDLTSEVKAWRYSRNSKRQAST